MEWTPPMAGRVHSLHLPQQADEATFRVGRLTGKTVAVAARNRYFCGGVGLIRKRIPLAEITLASGQRLRLGTDEPQRLARVLRAVMGEPGGH